MYLMADKLYYGWLLAYLSTSPNFGAGLVLKKLGPHTNLKTDIECLCSTIVYFTNHGRHLVFTTEIPKRSRNSGSVQALIIGKSLKFKSLKITLFGPMAGKVYYGWTQALYIRFEISVWTFFGGTKPAPEFGLVLR